MSTAVALTASSIRTIQKQEMLQMLRKKNKASNALVGYLLSSVQKYKDHVSELLTSSAEQRLARVLLRLAHLDKRGPAAVEIPILSLAAPLASHPLVSRIPARLGLIASSNSVRTLSPGIRNANFSSHPL